MPVRHSPVAELLAAELFASAEGEPKSKGHYSMWGEVVTSDDHKGIQWEVEGYEVTPPPRNLIVMATERLEQIAEAEAAIKAETAFASEAVANAVSIAAAEKLLPLAIKADPPSFDDRCIEIEEALSVVPDLRVHADQQGWRFAREDEEETRGHTYREWVSTHTSRDFGLDLIADQMQPDVVYGMWTCCDSLDPKAEGCLQTAHSDEFLHCVTCGRWVRQEHWQIERCWHHFAEAEQQRWGAMRWQCCGKDGIKNSKYSKLAELEEQVDVPITMDRGVKWEDTLVTQKKGKKKPLPVSKKATIGMRWAHMQTSHPRAFTLRETKNRNGCVLSVHRHTFKPCCSHCDAPLVPQPADADAGTPMHGKPRNVCASCGHLNRICTQCETVAPAVPFVPPPVEPPPDRPPASYHTSYELPGAPLVPPKPPARPSLSQPLLEGFEESCRFHPGTWCTTLRTRVASGQLRTRPPPPPVIPTTLPPAPTPPKSPLALPPESPPPTVIPIPPRTWVSSGAQTDGPRPVAVSASSQTGCSTDVACQQEMPTGEYAQTDEIEPQWCAHTTRQDSMSIIVRRWESMPRDFIIPGDKYAGNAPANGKYLSSRRESSAHGDGNHLRTVMDATRAKNVNVHGFGSRFADSKKGRVLLSALHTWSSNAEGRCVELGKLLPASWRIFTARRWRHELAPHPPSSSLPPVFGVLGQAVQGVLGLSALQQINLMRAFNVWLANQAYETKGMRAQLSWVGARLRFGDLHVAFDKWSHWRMAMRQAKDLPGLEPLDEETLVPKITMSADYVPVELTKPATSDATEQTERAWEWMSELELRGQIYWPPVTTTAMVQTMPLSRMTEWRTVSTQLAGEEPIFASTQAQTDENPVYGKLNLTRRTGSALENKVDKYRDMCSEDKARKGMREAGVRLVKKLREDRAKEAKEKRKMTAMNDRSLVTWAYTEKTPDIESRDKRHAEAQRQSPSLYDTDGRRSPTADQRSQMRKTAVIISTAAMMGATFGCNAQDVQPQHVSHEIACGPSVGGEEAGAEVEPTGEEEAPCEVDMTEFIEWALKDALTRSATRVVDMFNAMDQNRSGTVNKREFHQAVNELGFEVNKTVTDSVFDSIDENKNGKLEYKELAERLHRSASSETARRSKRRDTDQNGNKNFDTMRVATLPETVKINAASDKSVHEQLRDALTQHNAKIIDLFREWDGDGDGALDKKDVRKALKALGYEAPREEFDAFFDSIDKDGSGSIDFEKFKKVFSDRGVADATKAKKKAETKKPRAASEAGPNGEAMFLKALDAVAPAEEVRRKAAVTEEAAVDAVKEEATEEAVPEEHAIEEAACEKPSNDDVQVQEMPTRKWNGDVPETAEEATAEEVEADAAMTTSSLQSIASVASLISSSLPVFFNVGSEDKLSWE